MATVVGKARRPRAATIDPLKHSAPLGAALVFLGLAEAMPIMHGSQGCASFAKALLTRHFNEPIPLQTTALTEITAVLGSEEILVATLDAISEKQRPAIIGLMTTGVSEVNGEDVEGQLRQYLARRAEQGKQGPQVVFVSTPDFSGGLSEGWSAALNALVSTVAEVAGPRDPDQIAVLAGPSFTAADLEELSDLVAAFGRSPVLLPDLSGSLDGHLAADWNPLTTGGTSLAALRSIGAANTVLAAGATAWDAGESLTVRSRGAATLLRHSHLRGLTAVDALVAELLALTGAQVPERIKRDRARLADGLLDAHFVLGGVRIAIAGEPELLVGLSSLLADVGAEIVAAVSPTSAPVLAEAPCAEVAIGDLLDLEERAAATGAQLVIGSSHARAVAERLGLPHLLAGFPAYDRLGSALAGSAGYRGSLRFLTEAANRVLDAHPAHAAHAAHSDDRPGLTTPTTTRPDEEPAC